MKPFRVKHENQKNYCSNKLNKNKHEKKNVKRVNWNSGSKVSAAMAV